MMQQFNRGDPQMLSLLILDDAEDENAIQNWVPVSGNNHTLITSRFTAWSEIPTHKIGVLEPEPARELLLKRSRRRDTPQEREACDALAAKLEYLPLALEQAAAYVAENPVAFADYLRLYRDHEREMLMKGTPGSTRYPASVYFTWRATIDKLPQGSRAILRLHTFLASSTTPAAMFVQGVAQIVEEAKSLAAEKGIAPDPSLDGADELAVNEWVAALARYSMVQKEDTALSVHGLVHAVEWHELGESRAPALSRMTDVLLCYGGDPTYEAESRERWSALLPHAEQLRQASKNLNIPPSLDLLDRMCGAYFQQGRYGHAIGSSEAALNGRERLLGSEHPDTLTSVNRLAMLLQAKGDYAGAEPLLRRTLEGTERVLGHEHPHTLESVNNLAALLQAKGDYAGAEPLYRRALEGTGRMLGSEHPNTLACLNNLAGLLQDKGDYAGAEPLYRRALAGKERVLGSEHPDTLSSVNNLAGLLAYKGDYAEAEPLYRRALAGMEHVLGDEHPHTLSSVSGLAGLLARRGDYAAAESLYRRALEGMEHVLGGEHPHTLTSVNNLAYLLEAKGDYAGAELLFRRALEGTERVLGSKHPDTLISVNNLAALLQDKGDYAGAEPLYRRALEGMERVLGYQHPDTLSSMPSLIDVLAKNGREQEAGSLRQEYIRRVADHEARLPALTLRQVALECYRCGDYARAERLYQRVLQAGFEVAETHVHLARLFLATGREKEARNEVELAEQHPAEGKPYFAQRIRYFQVLLGMLGGDVPTDALRALKQELARPNAFMEWDLKVLLEHLKLRLPADAYELLEAIAAAMNDRAAMERLNALPMWPK